MEQRFNLGQRESELLGPLHESDTLDRVVRMIRPETLAGMLDELRHAGRIRRGDFGRVIGFDLPPPFDRETLELPATEVRAGLYAA